MEYLIQLFGGISFGSVIIFIAALAFFVGVVIKAYRVVVTNHDYFQDKEKTLEDIKEDLKEIKQKQEVLTIEVKDIKAEQLELKKHQKEFEETKKEYDLNKLRDRLLQSYRYYSSLDRNPQQAWSEMEKEAFDKLFHDYESLGGDGFLHTTVEPAMAALEVISMSDTERFTELMKSRKG